MDIKNVQKILSVALVFSVFLFATGCASNESKAEKLAKTAEQYVESLDYEQAVQTYIKAYNLHDSEAYKKRISGLVNEQNALLSIKEYRDALIELSENIEPLNNEISFEDYEAAKGYTEDVSSKILLTINYLKAIECENIKISGYVSDILNSQEYADLIGELQSTNDTLDQAANDMEWQHYHLEMLFFDFSSLSRSLRSLESLYDFPEFKSYTVLEDDVRLFNLSERLSLEDFSLDQANRDNSSFDNIATNRTIVEGRDFSDGVAWIRFSSNWACIDKTGSVLFELAPESEPSTDFRGGIAIIDKEKIINKSGDIVSGNAYGQYDSLILSSYQGELKRGTTENYNGLIFVKKRIDTFELTEDRIGIIDANGDWYLEPVNYMRYPDYLGDGMYIIYIPDIGYASNWILYNSQTNSIFETDHMAGYYKYNGGYIVIVNGYERYPDYSLDTNGKKREFFLESVDYKGIVSNGAHSVEHHGIFSDGLFYAYGKDHRNNHRGKFFNEEGTMILDISHLNVINKPYFSNGYCLLDLKNDQGSDFYTIIDKSGNMQFEPIKMMTHGNLSDNLYWTLENGIYTYRNVSGEAVFELPDSVQTAHDFCEGILRVETSSGTYYVDKEGNTIFGDTNAVSVITDYKSLDEFISFFVEKEGQMYPIEPLEFDINNYDATKLLKFIFVKCSWITDTDDGFKKQYNAMAHDMSQLITEFFGVDVSQYIGENISTQNGIIEYNDDSRTPFYSHIIEWGARGTYDTWAETESVTENGDGTLTVVANIFNSVNRDEWQDFDRKITAVIVPNGETYRLLSFENTP